MKREPAPLPAFGIMPLYAFQFVRANWQGYRLVFTALTLVRVGANVLRFSQVVLLSEALNSIQSLTFSEMLQRRLVPWCAVMLIAELLDYFTRRYAEQVGQRFTQEKTLTFFDAISRTRTDTLARLSKEHILACWGKYMGHVGAFLGDWTWVLTARVTQLCAVIGVLFYQDPWVLLGNGMFMAVFLCGAFSLSARMVPYAAELSRTSIKATSFSSSVLLGIDSVRRLGSGTYVRQKIRERYVEAWGALDRLQKFHATRWLIQLTLFDVMYAVTLGYAVYGINIGRLQLGFFVLVKWAFDELWQIMVYVIESYVKLIQQKEDALILRKELAALDEPGREEFPVMSWSRIELKDVIITLGSTRISVPDFFINKGERIGVIGPSGIGKSTLLTVLMNLVSYEGRYTIDGEVVGDRDIPTGLFGLINTSDVLFPLSVRENVMLGSPLSQSEVDSLAKGLCVDFINDYDAQIGGGAFALSTGQTQRIRLLRGLARHPEVLLLDEPSAGLDGMTKKKVATFLLEYLREKTCVLVTHDREDLVLVDRVYSIESASGGAIVRECVK